MEVFGDKATFKNLSSFDMQNLKQEIFQKRFGNNEK
jgi:hypothetical protein